MRWEDLQHGREHRFRVRPRTGGPPPSGALRVWLRSVDGAVQLDEGGAPIDVVPTDEEQLRLARRVADLGDRVLASATDGGQGTWNISCRAFMSRVVLPQALAIRAAPELLEKIRLHRRSDLGGWLRDEFQWCGCWVIRAGPSGWQAGKGFTLLGRHRRLRVGVVDGSLVAASLTRGRPRGEAHLLVGEVSLETSEDARVREAAATLAATPQGAQEVPSGSRFFAWWARYRDAEAELVRSEAEQLGSLRFRGWKVAPDGDLLFTASGSLPAEWRQLRAGATLEARSLEEGASGGGGAVRLGELVAIDPKSRQLRVKAADLEREPPSKGALALNTLGDEKRLERQERALSQLRAGRTQLPDLLAVLEGRGRTTLSGRRLKVESGGVRKLLDDRTLTPAQRRAVDVALNTPDLALIQGPPGTGKTTVIQVIAQRLHEEQRAPILLTSYQHEAVLRVIDDMTVGGLPVVRVGGRASESTVDTLSTLEGWIRGVVDAVDASIEQRLPVDPWSALRESAWRRVEAWRNQPGGRQAAATLVRDLKRTVGHRLNRELLGRLEAMERRLLVVERAPPTAVAVDAGEVVAHLARQRTDAATWSDDGPDQARRLFRAARRAGAPDDIVDALHACQSVDYEAGPPGDFDELLGRIRAWASPGDVADDHDPDALPADLDVLLNECLALLELRAEREGEGLADALQRFRDRLTRDPEIARQVLALYAGALGATVQQAVGREMRDLHSDFDVVIVDEAARANPLDLLIPLTLARRVILVGDQNQLPHLLEPRLERALDKHSSGEAAAVLRESFFGRLVSLYDKAPPGGIPRCVLLDKQFRMHPTLGSFISDTFYGGALSNGVAADRRPPVPGTPVGAPVAWFQVPRTADRTTWERRRGNSYTRPVEVDRVVTALRVIFDAVDGARRAAVDAGEEPPEVPSVGVISFYAAQVEDLLHAIREEGWDSRVRVGSVDAFQGREFDVVLLSTVRAGGRVGFLALPNRLNVAISRGKRFVGVVGDLDTVRAIPALAAFGDLCKQRETYAQPL